jgi:hypothetical protein
LIYTYYIGSYPAEGDTKDIEGKERKEEHVEQNNDNNDNDSESELEDGGNKTAIHSTEDEDEEKQNNRTDKKKSDPYYSINRDHDGTVTNNHPARGGVTTHQHESDDRHGSVDIVLIA